MKIIKSTKNIKGKYHIKNSTCRNISIKAATNKNSSVRLQMKEELMDQILSEIKSKLKEIMTSYQFGYDDNEWEDYSGADIYLDNRGYIVITVYAEVSYNGLVKIMDALNPIVEKYDSDAYFDADTPGRCSAYIDPDNVPSNMYPYDDDIQNSEKIYSDASNILAASKLTHKKFVNLLKRHFKFSEDAANIVANWYEQDGILDDFDDIDELLNYIEDDIYDMLDAATDEEEYDIVSKYLNTDTDDDREYGEDNNRVENDPSVEDIRQAMNHLPSQFKVTGNNLSYNVAHDSQTVRVAFFLLPGAKYTYTIDGKGPYSTNQEEQINFDLQDYFDRLPVTSSTKNIEDVSAGDNPMSFRYKGRRIKLLTDGTGYAIYEKGEMIDYGFKSLEDAEAAIDEYDDIYQDDVQVYSATNDGEGYWFFTTHGVQPGSVPKDVDILDIIDTPNGSFVKFNRFLSTKELNEYDMVEKAPKSVMSSKESDVRLGDTVEGASNEVELDPEESMIDMNIDQYIIVDSEGSWDYDSDNYNWASSDGEGSDWYSDSGVRLDDPTGVVDKIDELIEPHVPIEPGTYRVQVYVELYYTVSGVYENRYDYTEDDYSSDINSDFGSAEYNKKLSKIENVKVTKI